MWPNLMELNLISSNVPVLKIIKNYHITPPYCTVYRWTGGEGGGDYMRKFPREWVITA